MNDRHLTLDEIRMIAAAIGLAKLTEEHLRQLQQVTNTKRSRDMDAVSADLSPADEPATVFSLDGQG